MKKALALVLLALTVQQSKGLDQACVQAATLAARIPQWRREQNPKGAVQFICDRLSVHAAVKRRDILLSHLNNFAQQRRDVLRICNEISIESTSQIAMFEFWKKKLSECHISKETRLACADLELDIPVQLKFFQIRAHQLYRENLIRTDPIVDKEFKLIRTAPHEELDGTRKATGDEGDYCAITMISISNRIVKLTSQFWKKR